MRLGKKKNQFTIALVCAVLLTGSIPANATYAKESQNEVIVEAYDTFVGGEDIFDGDDAEGEIDPDGTVGETSILTLSREEVTINVGNSYTLDYELYPEQEVTFSSESEKIAKVSEDGKVTGVSKGSTVITITAEDGTTAECYVKVVSKPKQIKLNRKSVILEEGDKFTLKASISPTNVTKKYKTVKWTTSNKKVATVSDKGVVKAKAEGSCTITATTLNGLSVRCKITVQEKVED